MEILNPKTIIVDKATTVAEMLDDLQAQPVNPPSLYIDLEGVNLGRKGTISIIQLYALASRTIYIIDIETLQQSAFDISNASGISLRSLLTSPSIPKVFFDVRSDADALYNLYDIDLQNVHDVQLLETASRSERRDVLKSLRDALSGLPASEISYDEVWDFQKMKESNAIFIPEKGGSWDVLTSRPIHPHILTYCRQDVIYLPVLWKYCNKTIEAAWRDKAELATHERLSNAKDPAYTAQHNKKSPWPEETPDTVREWLCDLCCRIMKVANKQEHLVGKAHAKTIKKIEELNARMEGCRIQSQGDSGQSDDEEESDEDYEVVAQRLGPYVKYFEVLKGTRTNFLPGVAWEIN